MSLNTKTTKKSEFSNREKRHKHFLEKFAENLEIVEFPKANH